MGVEAKNVRANSILCTQIFVCKTGELRVLVAFTVCVWVWSCMWRSQPIWYGHHESNLVSNLFINIRDANKLKGKGHSVNNTAACVVQNPRWNDEAWNENKSTKHENNEKKTYWNCTSITLFFFTSRSCSHSLFSSWFRFVFLICFWHCNSVSVTCQVNQFQTYFMFCSDNDSYPSVLTQLLFKHIHFSGCYDIFYYKWLIIATFYFRQAFSMYCVLCVHGCGWWSCSKLCCNNMTFKLQSLIRLTCVVR